MTKGEAEFVKFLRVDQRLYYMDIYPILHEYWDKPASNITIAQAIQITGGDVLLPEWDVTQDGNKENREKLIKDIEL